MYVAPSGTVSSTTIAYRSPSTVITPGATPAYKSTGLLSNVVAGTARMRLGTTTAYTLMSDPVAGTIPAGNWSIYSDWTPTATNFIPGLTYHWALCFKPTGGSEQCGTDQTFVAVAADSTRPTINSVTYLGAEAGTVQDPVRGNSVAFRLTFSEPVKDLTNCLFISQAGIAVGQATWSPLSGLSTSYVVTIPLTEIGQGAVGVSVGTTCPSKITDAAGNTLSNSLSKSVTIDRLAPDTTAPAISTAALPGVSLTNPLQTWTASDAGGLASFQMKSRTTTRTGVVGAWSAPTILGRTVRQAPLAIVPGTTRCDQVTAYDTAQNHTAGAIRCTVTPLDERATLNTGVWTKFANTAAFGATLSRSTQVGATKYLPGVKGHSVVLVARKQPGAGTVQVLVNGVVKYTWNLASPTVQNKQVLNLTVPAGFTNARVSVRVKAAGTAGVWIDALGVGA